MRICRYLIQRGKLQRNNNQERSNSLIKRSRITLTSRWGPLSDCNLFVLRTATFSLDFICVTGPRWGGLTRPETPLTSSRISLTPMRSAFFFIVLTWTGSLAFSSPSALAWRLALGRRNRCLTIFIEGLLREDRSRGLNEVYFKRYGVLQSCLFNSFPVKWHSWNADILVRNFGVVFGNSTETWSQKDGHVEVDGKLPAMFAHEWMNGKLVEQPCGRWSDRNQIHRCSIFSSQPPWLW